MAISNNISGSAPYYDDFVSSGNDNKNYLRILFKPGVAVQARELNQIQSQIQNQIDKFGRHVFRENTRVLGGSLSLNTNVRTIDINLSAGYNTDSNITSKLLNKTIKNQAGTIEAKVIGFNVISGNEYKLFLQYTKTSDTSSGGSVTVFQTPVYDKEFSSSNVLKLDTVDIGTVTATGHAAEYSIDRGVFFVLGSFVVCEAQTIIVDLGPLLAGGAKLSYSGSAVLVATEGVVGVADDANLVDNALGTPNSGAPGADRYTINLALKLLTDDSTILGSGFNSINVLEEANFNGNAVTLSSVAGAAVLQDVASSYSELGERLARRTFEESGNYTLAPYIIDVRPHLNDGTNRGKFLADDPAVPGVSGKYVVDVQPNTAYVNGVRHEFLKSQSIDLNKARDTYNDVYGSNNGEKVDFQARKGNYILADEITGVFDTGITYELYENKFEFDHSSPEARVSAASPSVRIGECTVSNVEFDGVRFKVYLNTVTMAPGRELKEAKYLADATFGTNILDFSAQSGSDTGLKGEGFKINDPGVFGEVFDIGRTGVKDITKLTYIERVASSTISRSSSSTVSVKLAESGGSTSGSTGKVTEWFSDNPNDYVIISAVTGLVIPVTGTPSFSGNQLDLTIGSAVADDVVVIGPKRVVVSDFTLAKKTIATGTKAVSVTGLAKNTTVDLGQKDVFEITSVTVTNYTETDGSTSTKEIKDQFILDDGQRADKLVNGNAMYVGETLGTDVVPASQTLTVTFKHFVKGNASIPFTVEAYPITDFENEAHSAGATETVSYSKLRRAKNTYISDVIDFRENDTTNVDPNGFMSVNVNYFLPRYSNLSLGMDGNFIMTDGASGITPVKPEYPTNSLSLFDFYLNPFSHDVGKGIDGKIFPTPAKRYTMKDIGFLEDRIQNLEYYTSLSLLETQTSNKSIFDATDGERFKAGILVDSFSGHSVGNFADAGYDVAIDYEKQVLRPAYSQANFNLYLSNRNPGDAAGLSIVDGDRAEEISRLPAINRVSLVDQPFASTAINVNPFELSAFKGEIKLSPSSDEWHSVERLEDVIVNFDNNYDQLLADFNAKHKNVLGTVWNAWSYNWSSSKKTETRTFHSDKEWKGLKGWETTNTTSVSSYVEKFGTKSRNGVRTYVTSRSIEQEIGDSLVKTVFVPFIRSRRVYFQATDLRPNTRVIPFFDGVNIDLYTRQTTTFINYTDGQSNESYEPLTNGQSVTPSDVLSTTSAGLTTDSEGSLNGFFIIPNNDELRFKCGQRTFRLVDSSVEYDAGATTFAEAQYHSIGKISTYNKNIMTYKVPELAYDRVSSGAVDAYDKRVFNSYSTGGHSGVRGTSVTDLAVSAIDPICYSDPLAQSFAIPAAYPKGVYVRDIDLYFSEIGELPIHVKLVSMENGIPTQTIVPGSKVRKTAAEMQGQGSENATIATNFRFDHPIFLPSQSEFAIVVSTNSLGYKLWHSTVGENDITGDRINATNNQFKISKNPYAGVSFKSQNQSTWSPDQNTDFKMRINIVEFNVNQDVTKSFTTVLPQNSAGGTIGSTNATAVALLSNQMTPVGTSIDYTLIDNVNNNRYSITPGDYVQLTSQITNIGSSEDLKLEAKLRTQDKNVTPLIDLERMSFLVFNNEIDQPSVSELADELNKNHGVAKCRYITKKVKLDQAATRLDVFFDLAKPDGTDVKVYVKADVDSGGANSNESYEELSGDNFPPNSGQDERFAEFDEVQFTMDLTRQGLLTVTTSTDNTDAAGGFTTAVDVFKEFEVKLVLLSAEPAIIPQVKNLRCIATI